VEDEASGRRIATVPGVPPGAFPTLLGNSLWLSYSTGDVWRIDRYEVSPFRKVATFTPPAPPGVKPGRGWGFTFADDRPSMLLTVRHGVLAALDPMTGRPLAPPVTMAPPDREEETSLLYLTARPGHPGQLAVSTMSDVQIWDAGNGHKLAAIPVRIPVSAAGEHPTVFDPTGRLIAVLTQNKTIEIWDLETVTLVHRAIPSGDAGTLLGFDADGYLDVLSASGNRLAFLDIDRGQEAGAMSSLPSVRFTTTVVGGPVARIDGDLMGLRPFELPLTAQAWHDKLCAAADRPFTEAESKLLPSGADHDPPCR
jgi:hypothetical protein